MATATNPQPQPATPATFLDRAVPLISQFSVIPLGPKEKNPLVSSKLASRDPDVIEQWAAQYPDANVGIASDEEVLVLESDNLERLTELLSNEGVTLPKTLMACGSSPDRPHMFFKQTAKSREFGCKRLSGIFELRNIGQYVAAPGSIHPKGMVYRWLNDCEMVEMPDAALKALAHVAMEERQVFKKVADDGKTIFGEGDGRQQLLCSQAGRIWRGQDEDEFFEELQAFNLKRCDPPKEEGKVRDIVRYFVEKKKPFEPGVAIALNWENAAGETLEDVLREMNEEYCYVDDGDLVIRIAGAIMYKATNFREGGHMANRFFIEEVRTRRGTETREIHLGREWLKWPERRQVAKQVYEPGKPMFLENAINRWRGMGCAPKAGDVGPWKQFLEQLIPDEVARKWFEQWIAYPLQHLGAKLETAVILWSVQQGTGKTTIYRTLKEIYGSNAYKITETELHSDFNYWALDRQLIYADEISGGDKRATSDRLKELITGLEIGINQKHLAPVTIRNCFQFLFSSNHPNAFYLEPTDRRFFVAEVATVPKTFFGDVYYPWLDAGGAAYLYAYLLTLPMDGFNPHDAPPRTADKQAMIDLGRSDVERWIEERREFVGTAAEWLDEFRGRDFMRSRSTNLTESGMTAALKRAGGSVKRVTLGDKKPYLWSLDLQGSDHYLVWQERYHASHPKPETAAF